jgi:hypothetical protein
VRALLMELVEGDDLSQRIAKGAIPFDEALPIAKQIAEALEAAHEHAVAFHGQPRFTKDIDVFVEPTPENAERLLAALTDFGFGGLGLTSADFATPGKIVQLGVAPNRVDLLTTIDGVTFDEAWHGRVSGHYGNEAVDYIGRAELIRNKRASGRPQGSRPTPSPAKSVAARRAPSCFSGCAEP